jgi:hypothetical protein
MYQWDTFLYHTEGGRGIPMNTISDLFNDMGNYSGQLTVVLAIVAATILARVALTGLLDAHKKERDRDVDLH